MIKVNQQFIDDFTLCMKHYECTEQEVLDAKAAVRSDFDLASKSYAEIAGNIRRFPQEAEEQKFMLVSDIVFDAPKPKEEPVKKVRGKKVSAKKLKLADEIKLTE